MRLLGVALLILGLVIVAAGTFSGFGALFSWNGRHPIEVRALDASPSVFPLRPQPGRRYTLAVQVALDRHGLAQRDGVTLVEAQMPLVVQVKDEAGTKLAEVSGWLDPNAPPNVLYGQTARPSSRGPMPELLVERIVGPFTTASDRPVSIEVTVGPDRIDAAGIVARRLVIHDDALPPSIRNSFILAAAGSAFAISGFVVLLGGFLRRRKQRGGGIPRPKIV